MIESAPTQPQQLQCQVSFVEDRAVVTARGEIDLATAPSLLREVRACLSLRVVGVTVDFTDVTFLDSAGVHTLLTAHREAAERGITFTLAAVPLQPRRVLELTGLAESFGLVTRTGGVVATTRCGPPLARREHSTRRTGSRASEPRGAE
jgi:anti-sigma B factor antagonist